MEAGRCKSAGNIAPAPKAGKVLARNLLVAEATFNFLWYGVVMPPWGYVTVPFFTKYQRVGARFSTAITEHFFARR